MSDVEEAKYWVTVYTYIDPITALPFLIYYYIKQRLRWFYCLVVVDLN